MRLKRECINFRGMHDIPSSLRVLKTEKAKTLSSLARIEQSTKPEISEKLLEVALRKERQRFQRQDESLGRTLQRIAKQRSILLGKKVKNRELMRLREELQAARYRATPEKASPKQTPYSEKKFKTIRLGY